MSHPDAIDWSKVITDRPPPLQASRRQAAHRELEVFDLFGPIETVYEVPEPRHDTQLAS